MASPYTHAEMVKRQKALGPTGPSGPIVPAVEAAPDTSSVDVPAEVLNAPAVDDSTDVATPTPPAPATKGAMTFDEGRAKKTVVLNALRNSPQGVEKFASHIRRAYNVSKDFKATPEEILSAGFNIQQQTVPDLTPEEYVHAMRGLYGAKVDKSLMEQARVDYPGHKDETALIDEMYKRKVGREEEGPITEEDKAQIVARRYPELHKSDLPPEKALKMAYDMQKAKGKNTGSYEDWLHIQMAPTLAERGYNLAGGLLKAVGHQAKSVGTLATEAGTPGQLASDVAVATQAGDSEAGREAKTRLKEAGVGAANVAALAAAPATKAGIAALEGTLGAAETAPALVGAAEGVAAGGTQAGGEAAAEGKTPLEIAQAAATGAGVGAGVGLPAGAMVGRAAVRKAAQDAAEAEAADLAAKEAGSANLPVEKPAAPATPPTTDTLELAARHNAEVRWQSNVTEFAQKHGMDREDVLRLVESDEPSLTDLAAAQSRHGVNAQDIDMLRQSMPDHMRLPTAGPAPEAPLAEPTPAVATPAAEAATAAPAEKGLVQSSVSERMKQALNKAQGQLEKRREMRREQLSAKLAAAREAYGAAGGGLLGLRAKLAAMAGELKKPDWDGVADMFKDVDIGSLHDAITRSAMLEGDKLTAHAGLARLFNGTKMGAPTLSQIRALRTAFGSEFADVVTKNSTLAQRLWRKGMRVLNTPRTLMTSLDLSAGMRQGYLMTSRPEYWRAWNTMRKAFGSEAVEDAVVSDIKENPKYDLMKQSGIKFQGDKLRGERSEAFAGSVVDRWAGVKQSQRAYDTFINKLRADTFTNVYDEMASAGVNVTDPHFRESLAHWINTGTGRGSMSLLGRDANLLNTIAFSPRLAWSRIETFNPAYYASLHPAVRVAAMKANLKTISATMSLLGLMAGSGLASVSWDPRNSDFAKMRFGNTRIDVLGGHQQLAKLFAQMITGKVISSTTGKMVDLNASDAKNGWSRQGMTRLDVLSRFMEAKAAPLASLVINMNRGEDFTGKPISIPNEILTRLTPMPIEDVSDAIKEGGWGAGLLAAPAALVGLGVQSYAPTMPASAGGDRKANYGVGMDVAHMGQRLWDHLNGIAPDREMKFVTPQLANQWVKDAAMAQVMGQQDATRQPGFFDSGYDQKSAIRKATARRMTRVNKLYKDLAGGNGEEKRVAAEKAMLQRRAEATGMDSEALSNPNIQSEIAK